LSRLCFVNGYLLRPRRCSVVGVVVGDFGKGGSEEFPSYAV